MTQDPAQCLVERLSARGFDPRPTGPDSWESRCPAHEGSRRNLTIARGDDGRALLRCHAHECKPEAIVQALGMVVRDLFPSRDGPPRPSKATGKPPGGTTSRTYPTARDAIEGTARKLGCEPSAWWTYHEADGSERLRVCRFDPPEGRKEYRPVHPTASGWAMGDPPGPLPLYRLPSLAGADRVWLCEGEKCADLAADLGLVGTTWPHGARAVGKADWAPLAGREVVVMPDADEPGEAAVSALVAELGKLSPRPTVRVVRVRDLWRTDAPIPEGADIEEWSRDGVPEQWEPDQCRAALERAANDAPVVDLDAPAPPEDHGAVLVCLADVEPRELEWLWRDRIPSGSLTTIAGDPGLGKSFLTLDAAARVSRGAPWPDLPGAHNEAGAVVVLSAEDDLATTVVPRLKAADADLSRVHALTTIKTPEGKPRPVTLADLPALEQAIVQARGCRLVIIDPVTAYVGRADDHRNAEVRGLLAPLAELAARHRLALILVSHLNKNASGRSLARVMGSLAYTAAARAVWAVTKDRDDPARRLVCPVKHNLAPDPTALAYTIDRGTMRVVWEPEPIDLHADDALAEDSRRERDAPGVDKARDFLRRAVGPGPVRAPDVFRQAESEGIAEKTLRRAKAKEGIDAYQIEGERGWWWRYPPGSQMARRSDGHVPPDDGLLWPSDPGPDPDPSRPKPP